MRSVCNSVGQILLFVNFEIVERSQLRINLYYRMRLAATQPIALLSVIPMSTSSLQSIMILVLLVSILKVPRLNSLEKVLSD